MNILKNISRWCYRFFWYSFVSVVLFVAIAISLMRIFLPEVSGYKEQIEYLASDAIGRDVRIGSMDAKLSGFTPIVIFKKVELLSSIDKKQIIEFGEARIGIDLMRSVGQFELIPKSFTVENVTVSIIRKKNGKILIQGYDVSSLGDNFNSTDIDAGAGSNELSQWLFERSELSIEHGTIIWFDAMKGNKSIRFDDVNLLIKNDGDRHQITATASLPDELGSGFNVAFDFHGDILNPNEWNGEFHANGKALQLNNWGAKPSFMHVALEDGALDIDIWGRWLGGHVTNLGARIEAHDFIFSIRDKKEQIKIKNMSGLFAWQKTTNGWAVKIDELGLEADGEPWPHTRVDVNYEVSDNVEKISVYSDYIRLDDISHILQGGEWLEKDKHAILAEVDPYGVLKAVTLSLELNKNTNNIEYLLAGQFEKLKIHKWADLPGFGEINGNLWMDSSTGVLFINKSPVSLDYPALFRDPILLDKLYGELQWWRESENWYLKTSGLNAEIDGIQSETHFQITLAKGKNSTHVDLQTYFHDGRMNNLQKLYPVGIMSDKLVEWLDYAIVDGQLINGSVLLNGWTSNFPFNKNDGVFDVNVKANDFTLKYQKDWPSINNMEVEARFTGSGMQLSSDKAELYNSQLSNVNVSINDFLNPALYVTANIDSSIDDIFKFIVTSPIGSKARTVYDGAKLEGIASANLKLQVPLTPRLNEKIPLYYEGVVKLTGNNRIRLLDDLIDITKLNGEIEYSSRGIFSNKLDARMFGGHTKFSLFTKIVDKQFDINLVILGHASIRDLMKEYDVSPYLLAYGDTDWQANLRFGYSTKDSVVPMQLTVHSLLIGVQSLIPAPFTKGKYEETALDVVVTFPADGTIPIQLNYDDIFSTDALFLASEEGFVLEKASIGFNTDKVGFADEGSILISGSMPSFPLDDWRELVSQFGSSQSSNMSIRQGLSLHLDLEKFHIVNNASDENDVEDSSESIVALNDNAKRFKPKNAILVNGVINDFKIDDMQLGRFEIKSTRHEEGIRFDKISFTSGFMSLVGNGSWIHRNDRHITNFLLELKSPDLGTLLAKLGYKAIIKNGETTINMQISWFDTPMNFETEKLNGTIGISIADGKIVDVDPGAGQLIGLLSITELPKRLFLQFDDVKGGLSFKLIQGQLEIVDGTLFIQENENEKIKGLVIVSPIALISVTGSAGLATKDFDHTIKVIPNLSGTMSVVGWIVAGVQVVTTTWLIDMIFGDSVDESIATIYTVTGTWDEPIITEVETGKEPEHDKINNDDLTSPDLEEE